MRKLRKPEFSSLAIRVIVFFILSSSLAASLAFSDCYEDFYKWVAWEDNWSDPNNWRHEVPDPNFGCVGVPGVPSLSHTAAIQNGGTGIVNGASSAGYVYILKGSGLQINEGRLDCATDLNIQNSGELQIVAGHLDCSNNVLIDYNSIGEQSGGTLTAGNIMLGLVGYGQFTHTAGTVNCSSQLSIGGFFIGGSEANGSYILEGTAQLTAGNIVIAQGSESTGILEQSGGEVTATDYMSVAGGFDSTGTYRLVAGTLTVPREYIGMGIGTGIFEQSGGTNTVSYIDLRNGTYDINDGVLDADVLVVGMEGAGNFIQTGGIVNIDYLIIAQEPNSSGTYDFNDGVLSANFLFVGMGGSGNFIQTGGIVDINDDVMVGFEPNSNGTYELTGAVLNIVGDIGVGRSGARGSVIVDNGTINGVINGFLDGSGICVYPTGSLIGPGTFNLYVEYSSEEIYGTNLDNSLSLIFEPLCMTEGGEVSFEQITPAEFYSGVWPELLESSVFDVNFLGSYCGQFILVIPYDQDEVDALGINELDLAVYHKISTNAYELAPVIFIDTYEDIIVINYNSLGKFAVAVHPGDNGGGGPAPGCCPKWYEGNLDRDCDIDLLDLKLLTQFWLQNAPHVDIWPYSDNPPMWGDGIINFWDFAVLSGNWPKYGCN
jgi:hypothetical protein